MTATIAIVTANPGMFDTLRHHLLAADIAEADIHGTPLKTVTETRNWIAGGGAKWLVLDSQLPVEPDMATDELSIDGAKRVLAVSQEQTPSTPVLLVTPSLRTGEAFGAADIKTDNLLIFPMALLQIHHDKILRPFIAMLAGSSDEQTGAIAGGIRVIEIDVRSAKVECFLGISGGENMLLWNTVSGPEFQEKLRQIVLQFARDDMPPSPTHWAGISPPTNWLEIIRAQGSTLFRLVVMEAIGAMIFPKIEAAAGGLEGLSFRFLIRDPDVFPAPFEAIVRYLSSTKSGPFVLLHAPIVRRVLATARMRRGAADAAIGRKPTLMFIRSQVGEHRDQRLQAVTYGDKCFDKLANIDQERDMLEDLSMAGHCRLEVVDLSRAAPGLAFNYLISKIERVRPDILHYAGHAFSEAGTSATLILPGERPSEASGLPLDRLVECEGLRGTKLVYLSACRGVSEGSVSDLVMYGIPYALGFRWNVDDDLAPHFASEFYNELFSSRSVCLAFRKACWESRKKLPFEEKSPIWISPILLAQSTNWAMRS